MKKLMIVLWVFFAAITAQAQYDNYSRNYDDNSYQNNRYYYDDNFDWRWDARVRISDGIRNGNLTRREADRLYNRLEDIERREYAYQEDGRYTNWEQDEIWNEVVYLNRRIGVEINDGDRVFYGFSLPGVNFRGFNSWFYQGGYDFNRFDRRGFGNIRMGYNNRNYYPQRQFNTGHDYRRAYSDRFDRNRRFDNDHNNNRQRPADNRDGWFGRSENRGGQQENRDFSRNNDNRNYDNARRTEQNRSFPQNMPRVENNQQNPVRTETPRSIDTGGRPNREQPQAPTENRNGGGKVGSDDRGSRVESITRPDIEAPRERANGRREEL